MGTSFEATEKKTIDAEEGAEVLDVPARSLSEPLGCLCMGKQMRWLVGLISTEKHDGGCLRSYVAVARQGRTPFQREAGSGPQRFTFSHIQSRSS